MTVSGTNTTLAYGATQQQTQNVNAARSEEQSQQRVSQEAQEQQGNEQRVRAEQNSDQAQRNAAQMTGVGVSLNIMA